jgi:hypothetical protein
LAIVKAISYIWLRSFADLLTDSGNISTDNKYFIGLVTFRQLYAGQGRIFDAKGQRGKGAQREEG